MRCTTTALVFPLALLFALLALFCAHPLISSDGQEFPAAIGRRASQIGSPDIGDHPDWQYQNAKRWFEIDPTMQDHLRFHCYLAMSIYGPYEQLCPNTFTEGFTVLEKIDGVYYTAKIPEMKKIVLVFAGVSDYKAISWSPVSIEDIVPNCPGCMVAQGVKDLYLRVKSATRNFDVAKQAVASTGLLFSATGLGVGGTISALAAMEQGSISTLRYSHNSGMPRAFNYEAAVKYDNMFQFLAGQSAVSRDDYLVQAIPRGFYYHLGQKLHLTGNVTQWLTPCFGNNENATCLGQGNSQADHGYYFTPIGQCGSKDKGF